MSNYLSNLLTTTTSRYNSLRRTLLDNEADGDTEDDSHISRVLRAYYTEKGRPFPPWLPPDPNERIKTPAPNVQSGGGYFTSAGGKSQYGSVVAQGQPGSSRGSLSDLWDPPAARQAPVPAQPMSLRRGAGRSGAPATSQPNPSLAPPLARPLPSQRAGSYQTMGQQQQQQQRPAMEASPPPPSSGSISGGTAQERLKARLWGGGRASPTPSGASGSSPGLSSVGSRNPYEQPAASANAPRSSGAGSQGGGGRF